MQHLEKVLITLFLLAVVPFLPVSEASSRELGSQKNVYVTEWSKLKHKAELGDPQALFLLGNFYFEPPKGSSFRRNYKKAAELYFQSSIREYPSAQFNTAIMLHRGLGFKADKVESYVWFYFASTNDSPVAKHINKKTRDIVEQLKTELSSDELKQADERIAFYKKIFENKRYRDARIPPRQ
ncbi:tetratricopeptide repeat protein [Aliikangiella sp. G2MR2-5]|uniref:tetratricopeptide repeat protein n=1 Tax=Aliikangiella sp. G2MR2-5 TaxID=2788943 RepID=UPI0018AB2E9F|nr:sel1 repeat family protein [Aliikangiella sp. G2MR2-5]